jgi:septum formation protein
LSRDPEIIKLDPGLNPGIQKHMKIILASTSPIRQQMLAQAGIRFEVKPPLCDEDEVKKTLPPTLPLIDKALELAKAKALSVSEKFPEAYVIGSDQICELDGEVISKSKNFEEAYNSLKKLSGKTHRQNNGTCIYHNSKCVMEAKDFAALKMKNLTHEQIISYIKIDAPLGCAGSYKFELNGNRLFAEINGTSENIKGFLVSKVLEYFK